MIIYPLFFIKYFILYIFIYCIALRLTFNLFVFVTTSITIAKIGNIAAVIAQFKFIYLPLHLSPNELTNGYYIGWVKTTEYINIWRN